MPIEIRMFLSVRKTGRQFLVLREREVKSKRDPIPDKERIWQVIS